METPVETINKISYVFQFQDGTEEVLVMTLSEDFSKETPEKEIRERSTNEIRGVWKRWSEIKPVKPFDKEKIQWKS